MVMLMPDVPKGVEFLLDAIKMANSNDAGKENVFDRIDTEVEYAKLAAGDEVLVTMPEFSVESDLSLKDALMNVSKTAPGKPMFYVQCSMLGKPFLFHIFSYPIYICITNYV